MTLTREQVQCRTRILALLQFADQKLTSFSGFILFQGLFQKFYLRSRLRACLRHVEAKSTCDRAPLVLGLIVHFC